MFTSSIRKKYRKVLYKYNNRRCTTVISHVNINESNILNTPSSDNAIVTSILPHGKVKNYSPFNTLTALKLIDTEPSFSINDERNHRKQYS